MRIGARARNRASVVALILAVALSAAACSAGGDDSDDGDGGGGGDAILRYGYDAEAQFTNTFDIAQSTGDCDSIVFAQIFDTLVHKAPGNVLEPGLAESWEVVDPSTLRLQIRDGVTFHDGTTFDAQAVADGLEHNATSEQLVDLGKIEEFRVVDDLTLELVMSEPIAGQMPASFTGRDGMIMAAASTAEDPIGAGPFVFDGWDEGSEIRVRKYADYWDADAYAFDGIDFVQTGTGPPAVTALKSGGVDLIRFEAESYEELAGDDSFEVIAQPTGAYLQFEFRQAHQGEETPFADVRVRQAINHAIDREQINEVVQNGLGEVASQPFPKDSPAYVPELADRYPYDPERARELLAEAGYADGFEFIVAIPGGGIANMESQINLLVPMLEAVGLRPQVERILASDIGTQFYIVGRGDAFAAAELDTTFPTGKLKNNYGNDQYVAIWDGAERDDITELMLDAEATADLDETYELVRQGVRIAVEEALDVPIAFMPQFLAYDRERVGGEVGGQTNICDPPNLRRATVTP
ncbi:MAG TPA: ABC transporter substrate-binding protein [Acidimicrobiia bacterium]|nr:ABC transporter substrate-binding protein [Acidimicrobiia bacterium]